jgi:hypothetical protein
MWNMGRFFPAPVYGKLSSSSGTNVDFKTLSYALSVALVTHTLASLSSFGVSSAVTLCHFVFNFI